jgi:hypothetical protein
MVPDSSGYSPAITRSKFNKQQICAQLLRGNQIDLLIDLLNHGVDSIDPVLSAHPLNTGSTSEFCCF